MVNASRSALSFAFWSSGARLARALASGLGAVLGACPLELCQAAFKLGQAAAEFPHTVSASVRCCGSGRGPSRRAWESEWELAWEWAGGKAGPSDWVHPWLRPGKRRIGIHQFQRLGHQGRILRQRRE